MPDLFLYNPRCSKSRVALDIVREAGVELPVREYLHEPLSIEELRTIVQLLGVRPIDIVRRGEPQYAALGLGDDTPDEDVLRAMAEHPILIERPIVVRGGRAVVGRPPETVGRASLNQLELRDRRIGTTHSGVRATHVAAVRYLTETSAIHPSTFAIAARASPGFTCGLISISFAARAFASVFGCCCVTNSAVVNGSSSFTPSEPSCDTVKSIACCRCTSLYTYGDKRSSETAMRIKVTMHAALLVLLGVAVQSASGEPPKDPWNWTTQERASARRDVAQRLDRLREAAGRGGSSERRTALRAGDIIDGRSHPALLFPSELLETLIRRSFVTLPGVYPRYVRQTTADLFRDDEEWLRFTKITGPLAALLTREEELVRASAPTGTLQSLQAQKCAEIAAALRAARLSFGRERFDRLLYEVVAPGIVSTYSATNLHGSVEADIQRAERCQ